MGELNCGIRHRKEATKINLPTSKPRRINITMNSLKGILFLTTLVLLLNIHDARGNNAFVGNWILDHQLTEDLGVVNSVPRPLFISFSNDSSALNSRPVRFNDWRFGTTEVYNSISELLRNKTYFKVPSMQEAVLNSKLKGFVNFCWISDEENLGNLAKGNVAMWQKAMWQCGKRQCGNVTKLNNPYALIEYQAHPVVIFWRARGGNGVLNDEESFFASIENNTFYMADDLSKVNRLAFRRQREDEQIQVSRCFAPNF